MTASAGSWRSAPATRVALAAGRVAMAVLIAFVTVFFNAPVEMLAVVLADQYWSRSRALLRGVDPTSLGREQSFPLQCRAGWFVLLALAAGVVLDFVGWLLTSDDQGLVARSGVSFATELVPAIVIGVAYGLLAFRTGGWASIDPQDGQITWRRWPQRVRPDEHWPIDAIRSVDTRLTAFASVVRVDVGDRVLRLRVPTRDAEELAAALRRIGNEGRS